VYNIKENNQTTPLEHEESYKDIGVIFDEKLTFQDHIHDKVHKAYAMLGTIKRNFKYISINNFILLYKSMVMVRSLLDYCVPVWVPYKKGDIEVLEKVQKKATKIIPEIRHLPYREHLNPYAAILFVGLWPPDAKYFFLHILLENNELISEITKFLTKTWQFSNNLPFLLDDQIHTA